MLAGMSARPQPFRPDQAQPAGVVLAGGLSRRMGGGDKPLQDLGGQAVIAHVVARLGCAAAINANGDPARFAAFGLPVLPDPVAGHPGPLAGVLAALDWAAARGLPRIVTAPGDTPFLPPEMAGRLWRAPAPVAMAVHGGRDHPACAAWDTALREPLRRALGAGTRRMRQFMDDHGVLHVAFADGGDPFFNINTPDDLANARRRLAEGLAWT